ncbi:hypothetical protein Hanom_Chr02g00148951 [Helianthus anomalus]
MRKNKPLDESHKTGQTSGKKMAFYSFSKYVTKRHQHFKEYIPILHLKTVSEVSGMGSKF